MIRMGVEVDTFYRPVAYWIRERHVGEFRFGIEPGNRYERVLASEIIHLRIAERWPQTRGIPWLHTRDPQAAGHRRLLRGRDRRRARRRLLRLVDQVGRRSELADRGTAAADGTQEMEVSSPASPSAWRRARTSSPTRRTGRTRRWSPSCA
jgi:hypothetical protein